MNSKEISTLRHFKPLIIDDYSCSTDKHESFNYSYDEYRKNPSNPRFQKNTIKDLLKLIYVERCNAAHSGKSSFGPDRSKIERDNAIAKLMISINTLIFNILMDHPERKLACYGTLIDSIYIQNMLG